MGVWGGDVDQWGWGAGAIRQIVLITQGEFLT